jgi:ABC-type antimicrobial peptide transport system permease subunit
LRSLRRVALLPQRLAAGAGSLLGGTALLVAAVGLYALLALVIAQGRRELAVRAALGARPVELLRVVLGRALALVATGYALGAAAALGGSRLLPPASGSRLDLGTLLAVGGVLLLASTAAGAAPALRAWRVDPARALRDE